MRWSGSGYRGYFPFPFPFGAACDNADPAAVLDLVLVRPSRNTDEAALAAFGLVFLPPLLAMIYLLPHGQTSTLRQVVESLIRFMRRPAQTVV